MGDVRERWLRRCDGRGLSPAALKAAVVAAMGEAQVLHISGVRPVSDALDYWRDIGEALGRNADLIEDSVTGELTATDGAWMDVRFEPYRADTFRHHNVGQPLHSDGAYVADARAREITLFYLARQAETGGESLFVDAATIAAAARARRPALYAAMTSLPVRFGKAGGANRVTTILRQEAGRLKVNWNYYRVLDGQGEAVAALREDFKAFLEDMIERGEVDAFRLETGDAVFFLDDEVLHGRKGFAAERSGDRLLWKTYFTRG
jgi:alpha-ketoglutarate-dependent taurine dioxygenase